MIQIGAKKVVYGKSYKERLEELLSAKDHAPIYSKRGVLRHDANIIVVRDREFEKEILRDQFITLNLVTNDGDQFYAQKGCGETPAVPFSDSNGRQELGNGTQGTPNKTNTYSALVGPITASRKAIDATYPKTNDSDTDNTGAGVRVATWRTSWATTDFNDTNITGGVIHDAAGSPVSGSKLLTYWTITAFAKTATDTLKIFINHTLNGV